MTPIVISVALGGMVRAHRWFDGNSFDVARFIWFSLAMSLMLLAYAWLLTGYVFVCQFCEAEAETYPKYWTSGAFWCSGCGRLYSHGTHLPHSYHPTKPVQRRRVVNAEIRRSHKDH